MLNVFGEWNEHKPQLFKDVPITDMITPQVAYLTGQGSAEESMAGFAGPARIRGGVQYGKYGKNTINYGANQAKNYVAKEGQQFIRSQAENIVRNPGKPGTGVPSSPFSFTTQSTARPSSNQVLTELSKAESGLSMGGLKPGSVEPVIPWSTQARVAAIDAKNAVKGAGSKVVSGVKTATKAAGVPLRSAANFVKGTDTMEKALLGSMGAAVGGLGWTGYQLATFDERHGTKPNSKPVANKPTATQSKTQPTKTQTNTRSVIPSFEIPEGRKIVKPVTKPVPTNKPLNTLDEVIVRAATRPKQTTTQVPINNFSDVNSSEEQAIVAERNRLAGGSPTPIKPLSGIIKSKKQQHDIDMNMDQARSIANPIRPLTPINGIIKSK